MSIGVIAAEGRAAIEKAGSPDECEQLRVALLGRKGRVTTLFAEMRNFSDGDRPKAGLLLNQLRGQLESQLEAKGTELSSARLQDQLIAEGIDVTLPGRPAHLGHLHIITQTLREIYAIFQQMGYQIVQTPEVETDEMNFQLLNFPPDHPAREMQSTFLTKQEGVILRTHTSPGQIRVMRENCPEPVRAILPGKCYRYEQITPRSEIQFEQVEGIAVGEQITMADLKGVLTEFARQMFGDATKIKLRGSYFPFTEPSIEVDVTCILCKGKGCRICKGSGWLEILGSGMVHPVVLKNGGYDPEKYSGFAFGMGPARIAMLKYQIEDIRLLLGNDLRFLKQF
ncbi:phenylalanine--tRNA ligase subunit alpha [Candidatus Acetothermia bacterium]|nr:phenylalanine--tRNA ligase subunit alpha [Candidatus Acetothermia bacterium]MBI3643523.1 phenylalanine--tRNA ligase subunit alpha [Candidatus Acetothermia bacterium]